MSSSSPLHSSTPLTTPTTSSSVNGDGGTYVRPNRKERKGLYFITGESDAEEVLSPLSGSSKQKKKGEEEDMMMDLEGPTMNHSHSLEEFVGRGGNNNNSSAQLFPDLSEGEVVDGTKKKESLSRNGWQRTSLRKTPNSSLNGEGMNQRRWGSFRTSGKRSGVVTPSSNALASHLYRSSSYHSSGRSSAGDGEEMYSDSSLEGEVIDLTKKVNHLEEKFTVLADNQNDVDDRYTRAKQENSELSTKLFMLEEQLRDVEQRAQDKLKEEQKRHKEMISRMEREKQLQLENLEMKLQMTEKEVSSTRVEVKRLEGALERERNECNRMADKCGYLERDTVTLREQNHKLLAQNRMDRESMTMESVGSQQALGDLKRQLESLSHFHMKGGGGHSLGRNDSTESETQELKGRLLEAEEEIKRLKGQNRRLEEENEEISAQMLNQGLENGRNLLDNFNVSSVSSEASLAAELEAMSNDERDEYAFNLHNEKEQFQKMRSSLRDQKEANVALRAYIDNILLNIVDHYPQLLEVKKSSSQH